jgi:hypothetical protein
LESVVTRLDDTTSHTLIVAGIGHGVSKLIIDEAHDMLKPVDAALPLSLSDEEQDVLLRLAKPLDVVMRDAFFHACAIELGRYKPEQLGPGLVHRIGRQLQREFLRAPSTAHDDAV